MIKINLGIILFLIASVFGAICCFIIHSPVCHALGVIFAVACAVWDKVTTDKKRKNNEKEN